MENTKAEAIDAMQNHIMQKRQIAQAIYLEENNAVAKEIAKQGAEVKFISKYSPLIICNVTFNEALSVAKNANVVSMENGNTKFENTMAVSSNTISVPYIQNFFQNLTAEGIKLGMIELEHPSYTGASFDGYLTDNKITRRNPPAISNPSANVAHANLVAAIMIGKDSGIAKDFEHFYSATVLYETDIYASTEWMLDQGVNIINYSIAPINGSNSEYDDMAKWFDHIAYNHSVHCVLASGNYLADNVSNMAMAYNVITVGAIDDNETVSRTDDKIWENYEQGSNTPTSGSSYNLTKNNVAFKPDICAPGCTINIPNADFTYQTTNDTLNMEDTCGTSFAAPHVAGVVAILCSYSPTLLTKQALMKSILLSSVSQFNRRYDTENNLTSYRVYGSGIVNAYNAIYLIGSGKYVNSSITSSQTSKSYSLGALQANKTTSITLAFLKRVRYSSSTHLNPSNVAESDLANLNIYVYKASDLNTPIVSSVNLNSNVEKIVFTPTSTEEYVVVIKKIVDANHDPSPYEVLFAISWITDNGSVYG